MIRLLAAFFIFFPVVGVHAQELTSAMRANGPSAAALEQWKSGVDAIRGQMDVLIRQNDQLTQVYDQERSQEQQLLREIEEQRQKVEALKEYLRKREGKTDQDLRVDALNGELRIKRMQMDKILLEYKTSHAKAQDVLDRVESKRMKISAYDLKPTEPAVEKKAVEPRKDPALEALRAEYQRQKASEARLEAGMDPARESSDALEIKQLEVRVAALTEQKAQLMKKPLAEDHSADKLNLMQTKKDELEKKIRAFESRIESLKSTSVVSGSWAAARKEMVRAVVQGDARNKKLANEIKELKENIALLRSQIGVLEKRVLFSKKR